MQDNQASQAAAVPVTLRSATCQAQDCTAKLRGDNLTGFCRPHQSLTSRIPPRFCSAQGCERTLRITNKSGFCFRHVQQTPNVVRRNASHRAVTAERRTVRPECSAGGCTNRLRPDNKSGRCRDHSYVHVTGRPVCSIDGCETTLNPRNTIGRCSEHRAKYWVARVCGADGCDRLINAKNITGFCKEHTSGYQREYMLKRNYGITSGEYDAMLADQNGGCALCGAAPKPGANRAASRLHVDHDHETGLVRRLLCLNCNRGLGAFFDNPELLRAAAEYVEAFRTLAAA